MAPAALAQSSDTFNDTSPGPWWDQETANAALTIAETNNRLEFSTQPSPNLTPQSFAGYAAKNWRVRATSEIRARVKWRSFPSGTTSTVGSEAGVVFSMFPAASTRQTTGYRSGINISIGTHTFGNNVGARRDFNVNYINPTGGVVNIYRFWAYYTSTPFTFYNYYSGNQVGTIQYEGTFYIQYFPNADVMYVSLTGYNDPSAPSVTNVTLGIRDPQMFAVGGYGTRPAGMTGANAWLDDFFLDMGVIEAPPSNVAAEDGTNTSRVRVTWTAALNATGYRVLRKEGTAAPIVLATLPVTSLSYDDITAVPGTPYTYTVRMITPSGDAFEVSDAGWRGVAAPTGVVATDGYSTDNVGVSWTASTGAQQYAVFRALGSGAATEIGTSAASPFTDSYADAGLVYTYTVRARTPAGDSAPSTSDTGWRNIAPPSDMYATDGTSTDAVNVTWAATAGATGYRVFRAQGAGTTSEIGTTAADALSFGDTYAAAGTVYTYTVRARTAAGDSAASAPDTGWRNVAAPTNVAASDGTSTAAVNLTWTAVTGAPQYAIFRALGTATAAEIGTSPSSPFADTTATAGLSYTYTVRVRTAAGDSAESAPDTGWRNVAAPTNVAASDGTSTAAVNLTWTAVTGATGYRVLRTAAGGTPAEVGTPTSATFADTRATPGVAYSYAVRARTSAGDSAMSGSDRGWRNVTAPRDLVASDGTSADGIELSWSSSAAIDGFSIYRSSGSGAPTLVGTTPSTRFRDTTAEPMTAYSYVVRAQAGPGESAPSNADRGWRSVSGPAAVSATDGTEREFVRVTWTPSNSPAVTGYRVLRRLPGGQLTQLDSVPASASVMRDKTIAPGVVGTYVVRCITARGDSPDGASDTGFRPTEGGTSSDDGGSGGGSRSGDGGIKDDGSGTKSDGGVAKRDVSGAKGDGPDATGQPADPRSGRGDSGRKTGTRSAAPAPDSGQPGASGDLTSAVASEATPEHAPAPIPNCDELLARIRGVTTDGQHYPECDMLLSDPLCDDEPAACRMANGDVNLDGRIDDRDLAAFLAAWADHDPFRGDLNRDGRIDGRDLLHALAQCRSAAR